MKLKEVAEVKEGDSIKWGWGEWRKVLSTSTSWGWVHLKLEGIPQECTIRQDIELPWHQ